MTEPSGAVEAVKAAIHSEHDRWRCLTGGIDLGDVIVRDDDNGDPQEVSRHPQGDGHMHFWDTLFHALARAAIAAMPTHSDPATRISELEKAIGTVIAHCEALEDEASNGLATVAANNRQETYEAGYWRRQKSTAKSLRNQLHDLSRPERSSK